MQGIEGQGSKAPALLTRGQMNAPDPENVWFAIVVAWLIVIGALVAVFLVRSL